MNHKEELNLLKEQIALLKGNTTNEDVLEKINKTVERMEFSPLFKPYGLFFEDYKENEVEILNTHKLMPTQLDDLLIEKDLNKPVNLLLEGDNYQALKLLEKTHKEKIDVIYIDPPYNTGNKDFVYNDAYVNNEDAFRHSKWLSFMNKRLEIAKKLLAQEGIIFISIDDNEQAQLKMLCDQVFGEQNFVTNIVWQKKTGGGQAKYVYEGHEYCLVYAKNKVNLSSLTMVDEKKFPKNKIKIIDGIEYYANDDFLRRTHGKYDKNFDRRLYYEDIEELKGLSKKEEIDFNIGLGKYILVDSNITGKHFVARLENVSEKRKIIYSIYSKTNTAVGNNEVEDIFGNRIFDNPKPVDYIKLLIDSVNKRDITILDFFAGSGTTGQAVMELNKEDGGNRQFILATNNEVSSDKELQLLISKGYVPQIPEVKKGGPFKEWKQAVSDFKETISYLEFLQSDDYNNLGIARQVTYERLKRVINGYTTPKGKVIDGLPNNLKHIVLDTVSNLDAKKGNYLQKDVVFFIENVMEDLDAEYFKGESKDKVVYVVGEDEAEDLISELKENPTDKEVIIYTNIGVINQYKQLEAGFTFKKFPKL